jgi:hypothetical protein
MKIQPLKSSSPDLRRRGIVLCLGIVLLAVAAPARGAEWQALFDGKSLAAWKIYGKSVDSPVTWEIEQGGVLAWRKGGGNLATKETFEDFELELEWKLSPGGNSGIMFGVDEKSSRPWHSGPELQLLDDSKHRDGKNALTASGALYALYAPKKATAKPIGEWNTQRIVVQAGRIQSWLNGELDIDVTVDSDDWKARVAKSKFAPFRQFAKVSPGRILLQDHGDPVWFRQIRIRRL